MHARLVMRRRASHDIPLDIAAGAERCQKTGINPGDSFLQILLENSVKLNSLSAGKAECAICIRLSQCVNGQVLFGSESPAGDPAADHKHIVLAESVAGPILARVTIFLLVAAVKLDQLLVLFGEMV